MHQSMKYIYLGLFLTLLAVACGGDETNGSGGTSSSSSSSTGGTAGGGGMADAGTEYQCGVGPGTMGNSKGVGKYCDTLADCSGQEASICAVLGDPTAHFCTKVCDAMMPADTQCGENAGCSCNGGPCGCVPAACLPPADGGTDGGSDSGADGG